MQVAQRPGSSRPSGNAFSGPRGGSRGPRRTHPSEGLPDESTQRIHPTMRLTYFVPHLSILYVACCALPPLPAQAAKPDAKPTDERIEEAIENELLFDVAVPSSLIDVDVDDGIVRLLGTSNNVLASERAVAIARTVRGVRSVVDQIEVAPDSTQSLAQLRESVEEALRIDPATDAYEVRVEVRPDGKVELEGRVQSWAERELCERVAKGVAGVTAVDNSIELHYLTSRPDDEICHEVESRLHWDVLVDDGLITVACDDGAVRLSGTVGSAAERVRARRAGWVAGVDNVDVGGLVVAKWARDDMLRGSKYAVRSNEQIRDAVHDALRRDPRVKEFEVDVAVQNGRVTLRGSVDNLSARRAAADDARNTVGVSMVENRLRVVPAVPRSASAIASDARDALIREPYVDASGVTVSIDNGIAVLRGRVDSNFERACADDAVGRVPGVVDVDNLLAVRDPSLIAFDPYVDASPIQAFKWYRYGPSPTFDDDGEIRRRIEAELWWSPFVNDQNVDIEIDEGVVTLTGQVASTTARQAAVENAFDGGAIWVVDELTCPSPDDGGEGD